MNTTAANELGPVQNLSLLDRTLRIASGAALIAIVVTQLFGNAYNYLAILAIYPCLTGMFGWDPLYSLKRAKSCDISVRNRCGTYAFQVNSAVGKEMACNDGYDCSVAGHNKAQMSKQA